MKHLSLTHRRRVRFRRRGHCLAHRARSSGRRASVRAMSYRPLVRYSRYRSNAGGAWSRGCGDRGRSRSRCHAIRVGDHVVGSLAQSCGACARCLSGRPFQCQHPESTLRRPTDAPRLSRNGVGLVPGLRAGRFRRTALIHENQLAVVPKGDSLRPGCACSAAAS
jgi:hypothetical protein